LSSVYEAVAPLSYALLRLAAGAFLIPHGFPKLFQGGATAIMPLVGKLGFQPPHVWAYAVACVEFSGGIMVAIGLFTRIGAAAAMIELFVIAAAIKAPNGFFARSNGLEFELLWAIVFLVIFFNGGGRFSLDHAIGKEI
jgi:putative oxidoreductase